jgi:hypothetical protein
MSWSVRETDAVMGEPVVLLTLVFEGENGREDKSGDEEWRGVGVKDGKEGGAAEELRLTLLFILARPLRKVDEDEEGGGLTRGADIEGFKGEVVAGTSSRISLTCVSVCFRAASRLSSIYGM